MAIDVKSTMTRRQAVMNIVSDCCSDRDAEVHRVLIEKVLVAMAPPITAAEFVEALA